jgi:hypothetical protein
MHFGRTAGSVDFETLNSRTIWQARPPKEKLIDGRLETVHSWIDDCLINHSKCRRTRSLNPKVELPTRLLDVSSELSTDSIRLIDSSSIDTERLSHVDLQYAALSHCRPKSPGPNCMTTAENEAERREMIKLGSLPKTYQDAVLVTRKLGIRYIWIDSLCIIQKSQKDWEAESSRMSSVFHGAFLTLAATDAKQGQGDLCLSSLEPAIEIKHGSGDSNIVALVKCPAANTQLLHSSALNSRGWVLQELVLSRRTVHFSKDQLYWQCQEILLSEDGLIADNQFGSFRSEGYIAEDLTGVNVGNHKENNEQRIKVTMRYWWKWMLDYSSRDFTHRRDRLAALAGLSQRVASDTGLTPCFGMWKERLILDMSWTNSATMRETGSESKRSEIPNIPTWSWLCYETQIIPPDQEYEGDHKLYTKLCELEIQWMGTPMTSSIHSTTLILSGPVRQLQFQYTDDSSTLALIGEDTCNFQYCRLDESAGLNMDQESLSAPCLWLSSHDYEYDIQCRFVVLRKVDQLLTGKEWPKYEHIGIGAWWQWQRPWGTEPSEGGIEQDLFEGVESITIQLI